MLVLGVTGLKCMDRRCLNDQQIYSNILRSHMLTLTRDTERKCLRILVALPHIEDRLAKLADAGVAGVQDL